jgi:leukotriene-A4 hydrolase
MKYLRPLYRALKGSAEGAKLALEVFLEARPTYHPVAAKMVAADLGVTDQLQ